MQRAGAPPRADRSARPLGLPRSLAANLNPGPQFCSLDPRWRGPTWPQLAAHSSQLGCGHAAHGNPCTLPRSLARSPQFCSCCRRSKKKHQSTRAQPGRSSPRLHDRPPPVIIPYIPYVHTSSISHTYNNTNKAARATDPCGHSNPDKIWLASHKELMRLTAAGSQQPVSTAQLPTRQGRAEHNFPGSGPWPFILVLAFGFSRLVLLLTLTAVHGPVVCSGRLRPLRL